MKSFLAAVVVVVALGVSALYLLDRQAQSYVATTYATQSVRLSDPGSNLVGPMRTRDRLRQGQGG